MRIIPVLDLMGGQVVHGIRGERSRYRAIESCLTESAAPLAVARALQSETGCSQMYVADLDALQHKGNQSEHIRNLADKLGIELWVDAGVTDISAAHKSLAWGAARIIVGSETLSNPGALESIKEALPPDRLVFSMDIVDGRVMSRASFLNHRPPLDAVEGIAGQGWSDIILLTLDQVGTATGPDWTLLESARRRFPELCLYAGGGVRTFEDIARLASMGIDGVLVATAVHRGLITARKIAGLSG